LFCNWPVILAASSAVADRTRLADLWALLHEGGLAIDTCVADRPALRTLLQLDGDRLTLVALPAVAPLSAEERLSLAERHADAVRARSVAVLADGRIVGWVAGQVVLASVFGVEIYSVAIRVLVGTVDWWGLLRDQVVCLVLMGCRAALPWVLRQAVSFVVRWRYAGIAAALGDARHTATRAAFQARDRAPSGT
jgi:hypothetical protein